jgi:Tol biopolymer transport system component
MRDDLGVSQFCTVSPNGGPIRQVTRGKFGIDSAFTWHPGGRLVAAVMDRSVVTIDVPTGRVERLTRRADTDDAPRPEACVFSPDGSAVAYVRRVRGEAGVFNQIFVVTVPNPAEAT